MKQGLWLNLIPLTALSCFKNERGCVVTKVLTDFIHVDYDYLNLEFEMYLGRKKEKYDMMLMCYVLVISVYSNIFL